MNMSIEKLSALLLEENQISQGQLSLAIDIHKQTGEKLEDVLIKKEWISEDELFELISKSLNIPFTRLDTTPIDKTIIDTIPLSMARKYKVMPIIKMENELVVAMADPLNLVAIDAIKYYTGCKLLISISKPKEIEAAINKYYSLKDSMAQVVEDMQEPEKDLSETEEVNITEESDETSVIKLVNLVLLQAIRDRASDIHFEPDEGIFRIRFRTDGLLHEVFTPPKNLQAMIISRLKIMGDMDVSERRVPQDGRFSLRVDGKEIDIRASILPTVEGEKAVLRILDKENSILKLSDMGFHPGILEQWEELIKKTEGIVLITGPTGSGKSTTLYAVLNAINTKDKNIVTVENPVEYKLPLINQVHVNPKAGMTFASALRSILRQDPDVIMIGEIRDQETAEIAIRSALTGHLVFSTLHTNDAPGAIARLIDMGLEPFLVESSLIAVLAQRLIRRICPNCKTKIEMDEEALKKLNIPDYLDLRKVYKGSGCSDCNYTGYQKRTSIHELLVADEVVRRMIITGEPTEQIRKKAQENGMRTLKEDGLIKVTKGLTTIEEVLRVTSV